MPVDLPDHLIVDVPLRKSCVFNDLHEIHIQFRACVAKRAKLTRTGGAQHRFRTLFRWLSHDHPYTAPNLA